MLKIWAKEAGEAGEAGELLRNREMEELR